MTQTYRAPGSGEYSLRSFGKRADSPKVLPEGTLPVAVFSVLLTALLLPVEKQFLESDTTVLLQSDQSLHIS